MTDQKTEISSDTSQEHPGAWERKTIERLAFAAIDEQRRARRWRIFFYFLFFAYLSILPIMLILDGFDVTSLEKEHTALVDLDGVIAAGGEVTADDIIEGLRKAFKNKDAAGVILRINSPGGSPVQSRYINDEIKRLKKKHPNKPFYVVITDMAASGGYYVAVAADTIYADRASIVGSIGVLMNGFGFTGSMEKLGVERRLLTAGKNKGFLDPFSPLQKEDIEHTTTLLNSIHRQFINSVKEGRGDRLKGNEDTLFSGLIWTGEQAKDLGLIDEFGSAGYVAREVLKAEKIVDYTPAKDYFERLAERIGASGVRTLLNIISQSPQAQ